jgi:uncharacterized membrane protein YedE/YeeE
MKQQMLFPLSVPYRIYSPGWGYNLLVMAAFLGGVGILAFLLIPVLTHQILPAEAYLYGGGSLFALGIFMTVLFWSMSRMHTWRERRTVRNITDEKDLLATWQYAADEWHTLAERQTDCERLLITKWWHSLIPMLMIGGILSYMIFSVPSQVRAVYLVVGAFALVMFTSMSVGNAIQQRAVIEQNRSRRMEKTTPTLYISRKGLYHETEGMLRFMQLLEISLRTESDVPELVFKAWFHGSGRYASSRIDSLSIPIPRRHLRDAETLVAQFERC